MEYSTTDGSNSLYLANFPEALNSAVKLIERFQQFGEILNVFAHYRDIPRAAIITFSKIEEAKTAFNHWKHLTEIYYIKIDDTVDLQTVALSGLTINGIQISRLNKVKIFMQNVHSIRGKLNELRLATISCPFEIIIFTETWLNSSISNISDRYDVYRCDRSELTSEKRYGGGVLIAIDAALHSERIFISNSERLEYVCVKVEIGLSKIFLFAVYIRSRVETEKFMLFSEVVRKIPYNENDSVIVCGDFNKSSIKWVKADDGNYFTTRSKTAVCDTMRDIGMHQMCNLTNQAGNVLDLVFTNKVYELTLFESARPLLQLDQWHKAIEMELSINNYQLNESMDVKMEHSITDASNSLFLADFPEAINSTVQLVETFQKFGEIMNVLTRYRDNPRAAIITFSNIEGSKTAFDHWKCLTEVYYIKMNTAHSSSATNYSSSQV